MGHYEPAQYRCADCQRTGPLDELDILDHVHERVAPGDIMPDGQCPECGAACFEIKAPDAKSYIDKHIRADVTALVELLRNSQGGFDSVSGGSEPGVAPLRSLTDRAAELSAPFLDYEAAARAAGWFKVTGKLSTVSPDEVWTRKLRDSDTSIIPSEFLAAKEACDFDGIAAHETPIIGHYIITAELADRLEARGERVERNFGGVIVWARKKGCNDWKAFARALGYESRRNPASGLWEIYHKEDASDAGVITDAPSLSWEELFDYVDHDIPLDRDPVLLAIVEAEGR